MKLRLPDTVSSPQDVTALILELQEYAKWFTHNDIKQRVHAKRGSVPPELAPSTHEVIKAWHGKSLLTRHSLDDLIKALEHFKATAPTITITLAAPPTGGVKQTLVKWCRDNLAPGVLVNFSFNSTLLGGMVVRYGSHVFDWSFRRQILASRTAFPEVLRRV